MNLVVPQFCGAILGAKRAIETQNLKHILGARQHAKRKRDATETRERTVVRNARARNATTRGIRN
eukprot:3131954-Lingulodinium_polyedra.AAC.1